MVTFDLAMTVRFVLRLWLFGSGGRVLSLSPEFRIRGTFSCFSTNKSQGRSTRDEGRSAKQ